MGDATAFDHDPGVTINSAHAAMHRHEERNDRVLMGLLGRWVSELPPTIHVDVDGRIAGLGWEDAVIVWAPGYPKPPRSLREILTGPVFR